MAIFRIGAMVLSAAMTLGVAGSALAVDSKASCEYEGGETFDMPNGAVVCVIQIRPEEYHGEEYDDAQLGVKNCEDGEMLEDGLFCKITLVKGKKIMEKPAEMSGAVTVDDNTPKSSEAKTDANE